MNDLEIAPLAQRLAEENNVDWRRLQGSGANGRIVERDVLAYLARVMAGEEAVDPTPEPLPEGMEAWPDASGPGARPARPAGPGAGADAPGPSSAVASAGPASGGADADAFAEDEDLLLAGDDVTQADEGDLLAPPEPPAPPRAADEHLPDLFDDGDAPAADEDAPELFDGDLTWDADDAPAPAAGGGRSAPRDEDALDFEGFPGAGASRSAYGEPDDGGRDAAAQEPEARDEDAWGAGAWGDGEPDLGRPTADAGSQAGWATPAAPDRSEGADGSGSGEERRLDPDEGPMAPVADLGGHAPQDGPEAEGIGASAFGPGDAGAGAPVGEEDGGRTASFDDPAATLTFGDEPLGGEERAPAASSPAAPAGVAAGDAADAGLPLARSRQVLRRHVDFGGALALQRMLSADTGRDDLAVPALLLLAARRAGRLLDVERPGLVRTTDAGVAAFVVHGDGLRALAEALADGPAGSGADADLWVADLSGHGLDDAVLDADVLQLTLGRILSDGGDGRVRATLALAGDVPLERGAAFLARVAELIEEPLRLLL